MLFPFTAVTRTDDVELKTDFSEEMGWVEGGGGQGLRSHAGTQRRDQ